MRRHVCDVPGCGRNRSRWQRICTSCWPQLPGDIRTAILQHFRLGNRTEHRAACKRAGEHIAAARERMAARSQQAFDNAERLLGEH